MNTLRVVPVFFLSLLIGAGCKTSLFKAVQQNDLAKVQEAAARGEDLNNKEGGKNTPLHIALVNGYDSVAEFLIEKGADVNEPNVVGAPPLLLAVGRGNDKIVQMLMAKGASPGFRDPDGRTLLHYSAAFNHTDVTQTLLTKGKLQPNTADGLGNTPLHETARLFNAVDTAVMLIKAGATANTENRKGETAMNMVAFKSKKEALQGTAMFTTWVILNSGRLARTSDERAPKLAEVLIKAGADPNHATKEGDLPLHDALVNSKIELCHVLLRMGADPEKPGNKGSRAIHITFMPVLEKGDTEIATEIINKTHNLNEKDYRGYAPIHLAAVAGNEKIVRLLISKGVDLTAKDGEGRTALQLAEKFERTSLYPLLKK